jgi:hypothetical protein
MKKYRRLSLLTAFAGLIAFSIGFQNCGHQLELDPESIEMANLASTDNEPEVGEDSGSVLDPETLLTCDMDVLPISPVWFQRDIIPINRIRADFFGHAADLHSTFEFQPVTNGETCTIKKGDTVLTEGKCAEIIKLLGSKIGYGLNTLTLVVSKSGSKSAECPFEVKVAAPGPCTITNKEYPDYKVEYKYNDSYHMIGDGYRCIQI